MNEKKPIIRVLLLTVLLCCVTVVPALGAANTDTEICTKMHYKVPVTEEGLMASASCKMCGRVYQQSGGGTRYWQENSTQHLVEVYQSYYCSWCNYHWDVAGSYVLENHAWGPIYQDGIYRLHDCKKCLFSEIVN